MSVKKLLVLTAAGIASLGATAAMAGGPDVMPPVMDYSGIYIQGNVGYAQSNWRNYVGSPFLIGAPFFGGTGSNGRGGFTFGFDVGYQWNRYMAAELGWFYLPRVRGNVTGAIAAGTVVAPGVVAPAGGIPAITGRISSSFAYLALKGMIPLWDNFNAFAKFGVAYRWTRFTNNFNVAPFFSFRGHYWSPIFGVGLSYHFDENWSVKFQYLFLPSYNNRGAAFAGVTRNRILTPSANVFTLGVDYKFQV